MQKITPFLWFDSNAEEAIKFYQSVFKDTKLGKVVRYSDAIPDMAGKVLTASIEILGQQFTFLNGGPRYKFNEAISFVIPCESQEDVDYYWQQLTEGGEESKCGWLKDKFGLSWQVVPNALIKMLEDKDAQRSSRVMKAMLQMRKIELPVLEAAYRGEEAVA